MTNTVDGAPIPPQGAQSYASTQESAPQTPPTPEPAAQAAGQEQAPDPATAEPKPEEAKGKEQKKQKKGTGGSGGFVKTALSGVVGAVVAVLLVAGLWTCTPLFDSLKGSSSSSSNGTITINNTDEATTAQAVAAKDLNSVVTIYVYSENSSWNQYFGSSDNSSSSSSSPSALGSGVIVKSEGGYAYILTNYHVVEDISKAVVAVGDKTYEAEAVGSDSKTDLAVIKIKADGLTAIEWGDSDSLTVGQWVMAIGSPYGYTNTATTGIVSALSRSDVLSSSSSLSSTVYTGMIQTDAAINPGNSGGALVNDQGQLIGINTYISSQSQSSAGLGFAIPSNEAKEISDQLISGKTVSHAFLGITMQSTSDGNGVQVASVYKDTAADKAGLQTGDIITKVGDKEVTSASDVSVAVSEKSAGDKINITYTRNGKEATTEVTLGSDSDQTDEYAENGKPQSDQSQGNGNSGNSGSGSDSYGLEDLLNQFFGGSSGNSGSGNSGTGNSGNGGSGNSGSNGSSNGGSFWN